MRREARQRLICVDRRAPGALRPRRLLAGILQHSAPCSRAPPAQSETVGAGAIMLVPQRMQGSAGRPTGRLLVSAPPEKRLLSPTTASKSASGAGSPPERRRGRDHVRALLVRDILPARQRRDLVDANAQAPELADGSTVGGRQDESHKACDDDTALPGPVSRQPSLSVDPVRRSRRRGRRLSRLRDARGS